MSEGSLREVWLIPVISFTVRSTFTSFVFLKNV